MPADLDSRPPEAGQLQKAFDTARERYAALGVDVERALEALGQISLSLHCWQGDDVAGFESPDTALTGGIAATGNYPGKARNAGELRSDLTLNTLGRFLGVVLDGLAVQQGSRFGIDVDGTIELVRSALAPK